MRERLSAFKKIAASASLILMFAAFLPLQPAHAGCRPWLDRFLAEWKSVHPEGESAIARSSSTAEERMARFREGMEGPAVPAGEGAEGKIYTNPISPDRTLKIWRANRAAEMADGVDYLVAARHEVMAVPEVSSRLRVVQVFERGPNWIVREYLPESRTLQEAFATDPIARDTVNTLKKMLEGKTLSPPLERIRIMMARNPMSLNLHWDPAAHQIVMIDGF